MTAAVPLNGNAIRDVFRAWHTDHESLDSQLNESLSALTAYQSHLDAWQQQLAQERDELLAAQQEREQACEQIVAARELLERDRTELRSAWEQLELDRDVMRAARTEEDHDRNVLHAGEAELECLRDELAAAREQLEAERLESLAAKAELEREQNDLQAAKSQFENGWSELRDARGKIEQERDELRAERNQLERDKAATEKGQFEASTAVTAELNAARDKISALTTSLLSRTEELRTLDNRRAEVVTELELSRARERELKAALDELKRTFELERAHWTEELRQLRELLSRQLDSPAEVFERPVPVEVTPQPVAHAEPTSSGVSSGAGVGARVIPRENPVLGSIVEQFGKLRQQKAIDRQSTNRPR